MRYKEKLNKIRTEFFDSGSARKLETDEDILKASIAAELDAASLYKGYAMKTKNESIKKIMLDIAKEEEVHAGEFTEVLNRINPDYQAKVEEGKEEAKDILTDNEKEKLRWKNAICRL